MEEAFPCRSSGTNAACAPLLVLRGSSSPPCPVTEVAWADSSCSTSPRGTALRQSGSPSLLSEFWAAGFPRPGGLLADRDGTAVSLRPFGLSTFLFRRSSVEPWSLFFLASELIPWLSQQAAACWRQGNLRGSLSAAGEPSYEKWVNPAWRTKLGGNRCLSSLLRRGLSRGPWVLPFDLLADTKKGQVCLKPKKIDFRKFTLYPPHLRTNVDKGTRTKSPRTRRCKNTQVQSG